MKDKSGSNSSQELTFPYPMPSDTGAMDVHQPAIPSNPVAVRPAEAFPLPFVVDRTDDGRFKEGVVVLRAEGLGKRYPSGKIALTGASVQLSSGEFVCVTGGNGSGKSTLVRILALDDRPTEGTLEMFGRDVRKLGRKEHADMRGAAIEYIPQGHFGILARSALDSVAYWLNRYDGLNWNVAREEARRALIEVGVDEEKWERNVVDLAGGEQAAVAVARAFARNRAICIADEVMAAMYPDTRESLVKLLRKRANQGAAVLVVLHNLELCKYFDREWKMDQGQLVSS